MIANIIPLDYFAVIMFFISFFGIITSRNIIKSIIFILLMQTAVIMFWLFLGARYGTAPPIVYELGMLDDLSAFADPMPQALMLTAIIIGVSVTAINITMLNALFRKYKTADWLIISDIARKEESDD
ncbi:MAG: cation:proton antiporter subunit C [Defluviitaleaceae bacterium]|nr:cation:proton antiporter subunit C [Defluviitaleaceae bacterium]